MSNQCDVPWKLRIVSVIQVAEKSLAPKWGMGTILYEFCWNIPGNEEGKFLVAKFQQNLSRCTM